MPLGLPDHFEPSKKETIFINFDNVMLQDTDVIVPFILSSKANCI